MRERATPVDAEVLEDLEVAFARLGPIVKQRMVGIASRIHPELRPAGWNVLRLVLWHAAEDPARPMTVSEIITATQMDKSVVSRQLRDLKGWGFVTMTRSSEDARVFTVEPTELALARSRQVHEENRREFRNSFAEWDADDVEKLVELLGKLADTAAPRS